MDIKKIIDISRKSGINPQKIRRALGFSQTTPSFDDFISVRRRYELAQTGSNEESEALHVLTELLGKEIERATTVSEMKMLYELTPSVYPLKTQIFNKWRLLARHAITKCLELGELQKILFLIPPDTEEELLAIQKLASFF